MKSKNLIRDGFSTQEVEQAFAANYDHPLFAAKPADASLEGYIYPETYRITADSNVATLFKKSFDEFYAVIQQNKLVEGLAVRSLNLHQGITLASVIQKEVPGETDQKQVAQVFLKRLNEDIALQSDPTFIYPARQAGQEPKVNFDSPYNTYVHKGLPVGPIANFNLSAITAIIVPAEGEFLYFVADKEGTTHYSLTLEEHEAKVRQFCTDHCNDF